MVKTLYQWIIHGKLIPNEREQVIISQIKAYRNHNLSLGKIAEDLNNRKIPSKKGGKWSAKTVADVINNSLNNIESV
jgi:site-specific DNA recombinase